jgi:hypothetical protein
VDTKPNIVVLQAFPANRNVSSGIIEYMSEYFNVYFIDLPGFHPDNEPLEKATIEGFARYIEHKISEMNLNEYILAGISFGALLANKINLDESKIVFRLNFGPFLGARWLRMSKFKYLKMKTIANSVLRLGVEEYIWNSSQFKGYMARSMHKTGENKTIVESILAEVEPHTFFSTLKELFSIGDTPLIRGKQCLLINPSDSAINVNKIIKKYRQEINADDLCIIETKIDHFPRGVSYQYFKDTITQEEVDQIFNFYRKCRLT